MPYLFSAWNIDTKSAIKRVAVQIGSSTAQLRTFQGSGPANALRQNHSSCKTAGCHVIRHGAKLHVKITYKPIGSWSHNSGEAHLRFPLARTEHSIGRLPKLRGKGSDSGGNGCYRLHAC